MAINSTSEVEERMKSIMTDLEWVGIEGYEKSYQINKNGQIRTLRNSPKRHKFDLLKPQINKKNGYVYQMLYKNGKQKLWRLHRLVAQTFIPNPNNYPQINHKDGNKQNNCVENLEWCTQEQNMLHAFRTGLQKPSEKQRQAITQTNKLKQKRVCLIKNGEVIGVYSGMAEASRQTGVHTSLISRHCRYKRKSANGTEWRYAE